MKRLIDLSPGEAKQHFLKGSSYFNGDFPDYINFEPILQNVSEFLRGGLYDGHRAGKPENFRGVNYSFVANKDGRFGWRPFELMHPVIYVSLVNLICSDENWPVVASRFADFQKSVVNCCSNPLVSLDNGSDKAAQVRGWWQAVEQRSLAYSLEFSHVLHTDVTDCYGSLYTHSISWALHGLEQAKEDRGKGGLLGDRIDSHIRAGRYGQTNGISQGSVLMDLVAEIVLGYVDEQVTKQLAGVTDYKILRYRDDYRIFANSDATAETILKQISDALRSVGMRLGAAKTFINSNVVEGSVKPDKLAAIELQDLGRTNAKTLQKQLLRLHSFGRRHPNSGALRRLLGEFHRNLIRRQVKPEDVEVQVAIATDIAVVSPLAFPAIAGILSHLISIADSKEKNNLWNKVYAKMMKIPHNGYLEVWLQRVTKPRSIGIEYNSTEALCKIVNGSDLPLWENGWLSNKKLLSSMSVSKIVIKDASDASEVVGPEEVELFNLNATEY